MDNEKTINLAALFEGTKPNDVIVQITDVDLTPTDEAISDLEDTLFRGFIRVGIDSADKHYFAANFLEQIATAERRLTRKDLIWAIQHWNVFELKGLSVKALKNKKLEVSDIPLAEEVPVKVFGDWLAKWLKDHTEGSEIKSFVFTLFEGGEDACKFEDVYAWRAE